MTDVPACMTWPIPAVGTSIDAWQAGRCAGCGERPTKLLLDHDHANGLVRGLLCAHCNTMEGVNHGPRWRRWRGGWNPATLLGIEEEYVGWGSALEAYMRTMEPTWDELRAIVNRLCDPA